MVIGSAVYTLHIYSSQNLKDKRRIIRSIMEKIRHRFHAAIAEVDKMDNYQIAVLGLAVVSNETSHVQNILDNITRFIENSPEEFEISNIVIELL
ncbi:MAG: DUF503 domain-containing protein [Clostridiales bacterium]